MIEVHHFTRILLFSILYILIVNCSGKDAGKTVIFVQPTENGYLYVSEGENLSTIELLSDDKVFLVEKISSQRKISKPAIDIESNLVYYAEVNNNISVIREVKFDSLLNVYTQEKGIEVDFLVTEILSLGNHRIMLLGAKEFAGYSPSSIAYPHIFDLYFLDLKNMVLEKRTDLKSYTANSLQIIDSLRVSFLTNLRWLNTVGINTIDSNVTKIDLKKFCTDKFFSPSSYYYESNSDQLLVFSNYRFYILSNNKEFSVLPLRVNNQAQLISYDSEEQSILFIENNDDKIKRYDIQESKIVVKDEL